MKRALKRLLILLVVLGLLGGAAWYFLSYNPELTAGFLAGRGASALAHGNYDSAVNWYTLAHRLTGEDEEIALGLAEAYRGAGNYTKAEYVLANAIADGGSAQVYLALCKTYIEQDKLLDAVTMLDQIADPEIRAQLDAQRPAAPTASLESGFYNAYMDVTLSAPAGTLYVSVGEEYPSTAQSYSGPISLDLGETTVRAVAVADNGLVSPLSVFGYTISGVVEDVQLTDSALDAYVRQLLSRGDNSTLTTADLWSITEMVIPAEVTDFSDLSYFASLTSLTIQNQPSLDLQFLAATTSLTTLNLSGSTVSTEGLALIGQLPQLTELNLSGCSLSTLSGLENLTALATVDISANSISDLTPLSGNTGITTLNIQGNAVASLSPLSGLTELTWLDASNNAIADLSPISACLNLQYLDVSNNNLTALSGIGQLTELQSLNASANALADTPGIGACTLLTDLNLSNNVLTTMDEMASLTQLVNLDVSYNDIVSVPDFPDDAALSTFNGCHNFFEDVSGLAGLDTLNYVYLDYNNVSDVNVLSSCRNLIQVNVFRTNVTDVSALQDMDVIISYNPT